MKQRHLFQYIFILFILCFILHFLQYFPFHFTTSNITSSLSSQSNNSLNKKQSSFDISLTTNLKESQLLAEYFLQPEVFLDSSACPTESWFEYFFYANSNISIIIDIGFNKGYYIPFFLSIWKPWLNITQNTYYKDLIHLYGNEKKYRGNCMEAFNINPIIPISSWPNLTKVSKLLFLGFDLNKKNKELVDNLFLSYQVSNKLFNQSISISLHTAAITNHSGFGYVEKCELGFEICRIIESSNSIISNQQDYDMIPYLTVYNIFSMLPNPSNIIDVFIIDTEGYDPIILYDLYSYLARHQIRLVMFENNNCNGQCNCPWAYTKLSDIIKQFDLYSYSCYYAGTYRVWRISGRWWDELYEIRKWSNVFCIYKNDVWYHVIENSYVMTLERLKQEPILNKMLNRNELKEIISQINSQC